MGVMYLGRVITCSYIFDTRHVGKGFWCVCHVNNLCVCILIELLLVHISLDTTHVGPDFGVFIVLMFGCLCLVHVCGCLYLPYPLLNNCHIHIHVSSLDVCVVFPHLNMGFVLLFACNIHRQHQKFI